MPSQVERVFAVNSPAGLDELQKQYGATEVSLKRDVATLREWINSQPHLPNLTDKHDAWLKTCMMHCKNSLERCKRKMDTYFCSRAANWEFYAFPEKAAAEFQIADSKTHAALLPRLTDCGTMVVIDRLMTPGELSSQDLIRYYNRIVLGCDLLVNLYPTFRGITVVVDYNNNLSMSYASSFLSNVNIFRRAMFCLQDALPMRVAAVHLLNAPVPHLLKTLLNMATPFLKDKLNERIKIHTSMETFYADVPRKYLPKDYGGDLEFDHQHYTRKMSDYIASNKQWFEDRKWLVADETKRVDRQSSAYDLGQIEGSFRKLDVD